MSETKHTPGPWWLSDNGHEIRPEAIHGGPHNAILATTWSIVNEAERKANARLMIASPDMLAACEDMCERIEQHCRARPIGSVAIEKAAQRARAAIAKARP